MSTNTMSTNTMSFVIMENLNITDTDINLIFANDVLNQTSYAASFLINDTVEFQQVIDILAQISTKVSKNSLRKLLHFDSVNLQIPFCNHIIAACYNKYGITACDTLLKLYFNNNIKFYTMEISNGKTIYHLEHYRLHAETTEIVKKLKNSTN